MFSRITRQTWLIFALLLILSVFVFTEYSTASSLSDKAATWSQNIGKFFSSEQWAKWLSYSPETTGTGISSLFANFDGSGRMLIALIKVLSIIIGLILLVWSGVLFVHFSDGKEKVSKPVFALIAAIFLITMTSSIDMISNTMGINDNDTGGAMSALRPICDFHFDGCANEVKTLEQHSLAALNGVITFIRLVGYIAVLRGIYGIYEMGKNSNGGNGTVLKALVFILGGAACINVIAVALMFGNTLAPKSTFTKKAHEIATGGLTS